MNFHEALPEIRKGAGFTRDSWRDETRFVTMDEGEIVQVKNRKDFGGEPVGHPYRPNTGDMVAEDWTKVKEAPLAESRPAEHEPEETDAEGNGTDRG